MCHGPAQEIDHVYDFGGWGRWGKGPGASDGPGEVRSADPGNRSRRKGHPPRGPKSASWHPLRYPLANGRAGGASELYMKNEGFLYVAAAVLCLGGLVAPGQTHAAKNRGFNLNIDGNAESCADLKVRSTGETAQVNESFTLSKGEAPILELNAADRGHIRVRGWDRADYSVETCKIAAAETRGAAEQMARGISVAHTAGRISYSGPAGDSAEWMAVFFIHAPRDASLNLEAKNGPIEVRGVHGSVTLRATNGPIAIADCGGSVEAHTTNGPIAFSGDRGEVHLNAQNGPIAVKFTTESWNGSLLEARTINGPLAVSMPENFRSGMRLETSGRAPISCRAAPCRNAWRDGRTMQMNGTNDTIRLSTENGPVAVRTEGRTKRII